MVDLIRKIFVFLTQSIGIETVSRAKRFTTKQQLNLRRLGSGKGIRNLSVRNTGQHIIYISTEAGEREAIYPKESFTIFSPHRVCDEVFVIDFGDLDPDNTDPNPQPEAIMRYLVDVPYCEN